MKKTKSPTSQFELVKEFHTTFGHPVNEVAKIPDVKRAKLRINLILEEVSELISAVAGESKSNQYLMAASQRVKSSIDLVKVAPDYEFSEGNIEHIAKELTDTSYVAQGMGLEYGINVDKTMVEIHSSNMSKAGEDGKPIYDENNKVLKGPNYREPDMKNALVLEEENAA